MNSFPHQRITSYSVGKSGGSTGELYDPSWSGRGLDSGQDILDDSDPLVIWWARLLEKGISANRSKTGSSYRRSRWGHGADLRTFSYTPYIQRMKEGRLISFYLCALILALGSSLNMVALAQTASAGGIVTSGMTSAAQIQDSERFSRVKDFVGQHNQYLDLSKLNEFKWKDESRVSARAESSKRAGSKGFNSTYSNMSVQPRVVNQESSENALESDTKLREVLRNRGAEGLDFASGESAKSAK